MLTTCNEVSPTFSSSRTLPPPRPRPHPTNHPSTRYLFITVKWSLALSRFCCCCSKNQALRRRTAGRRTVRQRRRYSEAHVQHNASGAAAATAGAKVRYLFGGILPCVSVSVETSAYSSRCLHRRLNSGPSVYSDFFPFYLLLLTVSSGSLELRAESSLSFLYPPTPPPPRALGLTPSSRALTARGLSEQVRPRTDCQSLQPCSTLSKAW